MKRELKEIYWRQLEKLNKLKRKNKEQKEEAELFAGQYDRTTKLNPIDSYRANIIKDDEIDTLIKEICDKFGISVTNDKAPKVLGSLTVVRNIIKPSVTNSVGKSSDARENVKIVE